MSVPLSVAVDMAVRGIFPDEKRQSVKLDGHGFYIRSLKNKNLLKSGDTGYFRHQHVGKDDRVFFSVKLNKNGGYNASITRIQYRGPFNSGTRKFAVPVAGALAVVGGAKGVVAAAIIKKLKNFNLQSKIDGNWEVQAARVVDAIGLRMAAKSKR